MVKNMSFLLISGCYEEKAWHFAQNILKDILRTAVLKSKEHN